MAAEEDKEELRKEYLASLKTPEELFKAMIYQLLEIKDELEKITRAMTQVKNAFLGGNHN